VPLNHFTLPFSVLILFTFPYLLLTLVSKILTENPLNRFVSRMSIDDLNNLKNCFFATVINK